MDKDFFFFMFALLLSSFSLGKLSVSFPLGKF